MSTVQLTDEALLLSGDLEDFGRFYDRYAPWAEPESIGRVPAC